MMTPMLLNYRYKIVEKLYSGGFGETFLAEDTQMPSGRKCLIKQLKPVVDNPEIYQLVQERFQREAAILEELGNSHNQIPKLYAYFVNNKYFYLVQEYIKGQSLTTKLQQQRFLSESSVKEILTSLLPVLEYVHSKRIVHRDIKPDNIIIRDAPELRRKISTILMSLTQCADISASHYQQMFTLAVRRVGLLVLVKKQHTYQRQTGSPTFLLSLLKIVLMHTTGKYFLKSLALSSIA